MSRSIAQMFATSRFSSASVYCGPPAAATLLSAPSGDPTPSVNALEPLGGHDTPGNVILCVFDDAASCQAITPDELQETTTLLRLQANLTQRAGVAELLKE